MLIKSCTVRRDTPGSRLEVFIFAEDINPMVPISTETLADFTVEYYGSRDAVFFTSSLHRCAVNPAALGSRTGRDFLALYNSSESADFFDCHSDELDPDSDPVPYEGRFNALAGYPPVYPVTIVTALFHTRVLFIPALYVLELLKKYRQPWTLEPALIPALNGDLVFELRHSDEYTPYTYAG